MNVKLSLSQQKFRHLYELKKKKKINPKRKRATDK